MENKRHGINKRVIADLKKRSTIGIVFYIILAFIVLYSGDYYQRHQKFSLLFFTAVNAICLIRLSHVSLFSKLEEINERLNNIIFFASVILTALIWGLGFAVFMVQDAEYSSKILMAICTAGLCSGGIVAFIPNRSLSIAFNVLITMPAFFLMIYYGTNIPLAIMILLYMLYMFLMTIRGNGEYWDALENELKLQEKSKELKELSRTDVLTGLFNRRYLDELMEVEWKRASREDSVISVVIGDIDHFKDVNDTYGHLAGDECLKEIARVLKNTFQRETDILARYGGEEFFVVLPGTDSETAFIMAETARQEIKSNRVHYAGQQISMTISFGVATMIPQFRQDKDEIISKADCALYKAKNEGRNRVSFC